MRKLLAPLAVALGLAVAAAPAGAAAPKPSFTFKTGSYSATEGNTVPVTAQILITRSSSVGSATVSFRTVGGTATPSDAAHDCGDTRIDYRVQSGTSVTFNPGQVQLAVPDGVVICPDIVYEGNETIAMQLFNPQNGYSVANKSAVPLNVIDNDPVPTISIDNAHGTEGDLTPISLPLKLSGPTQSGVTVHYATVDGSATHPEDYDATSGNATWPPYSNGDGAVNVQTHDDHFYGLGESFAVNLSGNTAGTIATPSGTGTIDEIDPKPAVSSNSVTNDEGSPIGFTFSLDKKSEAPTSIDYATFDRAVNNGATGGSTCAGATDYLTTSGTTSIPAGSTSTGPVNVPTCQDSVVEDNEIFDLGLSNIVNGTLASNGVGTIRDDDAASLAYAGALPPANGTYDTRWFVTNKNGDALNTSNGSPVLLRFEQYRTGNGASFDGVPGPGGGSADYDYVHDNLASGGGPTQGNETTGIGTFRAPVPPSGSSDTLVACVVTAQSTTESACGVASAAVDGETYGGGLIDDVFGPLPNPTTATQGGFAF